MRLHSNRLGMSYLAEGDLFLRPAIGYLANAGSAQIPECQSDRHAQVPYLNQILFTCD